MCEESNRSFASETAPQAGKTRLRLSVAGLRRVLSEPVGLLRIVSEPNERLDSGVNE
jgi:hypothetical protein